MTDPIERTIDRELAHRSAILEEAMDSLSLGLVIFDSKGEVVFCNIGTWKSIGFHPTK